MMRFKGCDRWIGSKVERIGDREEMKELGGGMEGVGGLRGVVKDKRRVEYEARRW